MSFNANADNLTIGVIGAGAMGQGIVQVSLQGGMKVVLFDANTEGASAGKDLIFQRLDRSAERGRLELDAVGQMKSNLQVTGSLSAFHSVMQSWKPCLKTWMLNMLFIKSLSSM